MGVKLVDPGIFPVVGSWSGLSRSLRWSFEPTDQGKCCSHWPILDKHDAAPGAQAQGGAGAQGGAHMQGLHRLEECGAHALGA